MKIFIAIPAAGHHNTLAEQYLLDAIPALIKSGIDVRCFLVHGYSVDVARNRAVDEFLRSDASHILFLDADIAVSASDITALADRNLKAVSALYTKRGDESADPFVEAYSVEIDIDGEDSTVCHISSQLKNRLSKIDGCGFGCILIDRGTVERVVRECTPPAFQYHHYPEVISEDFHFCTHLISLGIPLYVDGRVYVRHIGEKIY